MLFHVFCLHLRSPAIDTRVIFTVLKSVENVIQKKQTFQCMPERYAKGISFIAYFGKFAFLMLANWFQSLYYVRKHVKYPGRPSVHLADRNNIISYKINKLTGRIACNEHWHIVTVVTMVTIMYDATLFTRKLTTVL